MEEKHQDSFPAHVRCDALGNWEIQSVEEHCRNTAAYAAGYLKCVGMSSLGYLAGLLHDMGKAKKEFEEYILLSATKDIKKRKIIHSFSGLRWMFERYRQSDYYHELCCELVAFAIGSHHGLFDIIDEEGNNGFDYRCTKKGICYDETVDNFFKGEITVAEVDKLFQEAEAEVEEVYNKILGIYPESYDDDADTEISFHLSLMERLLLSAVIDGDRRDTAEYMRNAKHPSFPEDMRALWTGRLEHVERKLNAMSHNSALNVARRGISDQCRQMAEQPGGIYRFNVPTGAGKTLSSLRYALAHAAKWNKKHIIFTSPLLSILDQNAAIIRDYVGDDSIVLEHHSNVIREKSSKNDEDELDYYELLTENWSSPIIVTTLVQLLNTCFKGKTSCIRRFHALADSIIIIDEVQTVPANMISLFNMAVTFLSQVCGSTIVLCSATQPYLEKTQHPLRTIAGDIGREAKIDWDVFNRTEIKRGGSVRKDELDQFIGVWLKTTKSLLVVCNKKKEAQELYKAVKNLPGVRTFHLSAAMCVKHRRVTLDNIRKSLDSDDGYKTVCISTQVIEAGVDISFEMVVRLTAGMDSVVQSAGRCNRNGERSGRAPVYLVDCTDEDLSHLVDIKHAKDATLALLDSFERNPAAFENNLSSDPAIRFFYKKYYGQMGDDKMDYKVGHTSLFLMLSINRAFYAKYIQANGATQGDLCIRQAFKTAGAAFEVFDDDTTDIIVPYGDGRKIINDIYSAVEERQQSEKTEWDSLLEQVKLYTVSIYGYERKRLESEGALTSLLSGRLMILSDGFYDEDMGLYHELSTTGFAIV